jgi:hypothetical protein
VCKTILPHIHFQRQAEAELKAYFPQAVCEMEQDWNRWALLRSYIVGRAREMELRAQRASECDLDPHAEHGEWVGTKLHYCADRTISTAIGKSLNCLHCGQHYCAACDREVQA